MADVASDLKTWSTTAASNAPTDSTTIGAGLADNFQEVQKVVRQDLAHKGADIVAAATTDLGAVVGFMHDITGSATITSFGTVSAGIWKLLKFEGANTLTHNATSLILPNGANITTADGDTLLAMSEGSGNWRVHVYAGKNSYHTNLTLSGNLIVSGNFTLTASSGNVGASTYTPTLTNTLNITSSTSADCHWLRVGNTVHVSGQVLIDPNVGGNTTQLSISLPVASALAAEGDLSGVGTTRASAGNVAAIYADATNDLAIMQWVAGDVTSQQWNFIFSYQVI